MAGVLTGLGGCSDEVTPRLGPQQWQDIVFLVETRPPQLRIGMNEFLVLASIDGHKPAHDMILSFRLNGEGKWQQAIQDGYVGVYRKAIRVNDIENDVLEVRVERYVEGQNERDLTLLRFPLRQQTEKRAPTPTSETAKD
ncbi:MAG: hypothetical protein GXP10_08630 [Gammaproteobacteria bacterium]|nr:hypothetical protein [Gammaproteobacteria bacterium]